MSLQAYTEFADPSSMQTSLCSSLAKILRLFITVFFVGMGKGSVKFGAGLKNPILKTLTGLVLPVQLGRQKSVVPYLEDHLKGKQPCCN